MFGIRSHRHLRSLSRFSEAEEVIKSRPGDHSRHWDRVEAPMGFATERDRNGSMQTSGLVSA